MGFFIWFLCRRNSGEHTENKTPEAVERGGEKNPQFVKEQTIRTLALNL